MSYDVSATKEKVYIHNERGCVARLCEVSAEFFGEDGTSVETIDKCSFEKFQKEALRRGYKVKDYLRPNWKGKA